MVKTCFRCKTTQPIEAFNKHCIQPDGLNHICKSCRSIERKEKRATAGDAERARWRERYAKDEKFRERCKDSAREIYRRDPQQYRNAWFKRQYGIDVSTYNKMFTDQAGCCAICAKHQSEFKKALAVDHDHENGAVRGLLCDRCNPMIGQARDDPSILESAAIYLRRNKIKLVEVNEQ